MKEHDLVLSYLSNPSHSIADFQAAGYTVDNTSIEQNEDDYKKYKIVLDLFKRDDGTFDDVAFHQFYLNVNTVYNGLSQKHTVEELYNLTSWKANNFFAPEGAKKRQSPDIEYTKILNPTRDSWSTSILGKFKEGTESTDEIAQSNKVLANPVDVENGAKPIWHDSPNDSFWTDFWDTRVLAQWDYDADENGKRTNDPNKIVHPKGSLKYNDNGEPYYENLQGRDVYGRKVLSKLNTLTVDGSDINHYDFFDSDDKNEKSVTGTLMKNLALVGTMFIPYVGPVIAGLSMGTQVTNMAMKLSKMLLGSDMPTLSAIEGWTESWDRQGLKSEYAQNNTWCWENMIDVVGDLVGLLREQRVIFLYAPALFKGAKAIEWNGFTKNAEKNFLEELAALWEKKYTMEALGAALKTSEGAYMALDLKKLSNVGAQVAYRLYMKDYYRIGEVLSKMYMAGLISSNMYSEAKANGVSDENAAWMTFGRFAAEMGLLYTPMGNAILPELRAAKLAERSIIESAINRTSTFAKVNLIAASNSDKMFKFKSIFNLGSKLADKGAERMYANNLIDTFTASFANGIEVGVVNDIEEFLNDMTRTVYNSIYSGDDSKPKLEAWNNMFDRYGMGMVSGLVGGTITSAFTNYGQITDARATTPEQALQQMIYLERQGELDKVLKNLDRYTIGDKNLSATKYDIIKDEDGDEQIIWRAGTKEDNQDLVAKLAIRLLANLVKQILDNNGINITDESFLKTQTPEYIKELKFNLLLNSFAAGRILLKFNTACSDIVRLTNEINNLTPKTDAKKSAAEKGETIESESIEEKKKLLKEAVKIKEDILAGKYSQEFIRDVIYEMSPAINHAFIKPSFVRYAEYVKHKPIKDIPENELDDLKRKWEAWKLTDMKDYLHISAGIHQDIVLRTADVIRNADKILNDTNDPILKLIQSYQEFGFEGRMLDAIAEQQRAGIEITPEVYSLLAKQILELSFNELGLLLYQNTNTTESFNNLINLVNQYNSTRNDLNQKERNNELREQIDSIIRDNFNKNLGKIVNPIIERGYVNSEVRNNILNILLLELARQVEELNKFEYIAQLTPAQETTLLELKKNSQLIQESIQKIKELPHTPIEEILDLFSVSVKGEPIKITDLINRLNGLLKGSESDPSAILFGNDVMEQVSQAILLLDIFEAVVEGAKKDAGRLNNMLGYNHYLNLLMPETNAPEITTESGNVIIQDLHILRNKLSFLKQLVALNQAQKIGTNHRVLLNFNYLVYDRLKTLKIPTGWNGIEEWKSALAEAETLEANIAKRNLGIHPDARNAINLEMLKIRNALYELLNKNLDNLSELFSMLNFNYFDSTSNIINEASESLNDASLLGWIVDSGALKYSDFKKMLLDIENSDIAPIFSQELASYKQLGRLVNGKFYKAVYDAVRNNLVEYWKNLSKEERLEVAKRTYPDGSQELIEELTKQEDVLNSFSSLRYLNEIFTEGIPGSGKTNAVLPITLKILLKNYSSLLKNVAYIHGGNIESAKLGIEKLKELGIDTSGFTAFDKNGFLERISKWIPYQSSNGLAIVPKERIKINPENGEFVSSDEIKYTDKPFTLIIFDEATNANAFEHDVINAYGNQYGTTTLAFGDLDQDGSYAQAKINGITYNTGVAPLNFFPGLKLGVSMRVNNSLKAQNLKTAKLWVNSNSNERLELHYYEDETGLYGERVFDYDDTVDFGLLEDTINKMFSTLKEGLKIGYIVSDPETSDVYQILMLDKYKDKIEVFNINEKSALGLEALYYIVDIVPFEKDGVPTIDKDFRRHIYTGLSRSSQGTLIINEPYSYEDGIHVAPIYNNIQDTETISQELPTEEIKRLIELDNKFWAEHVADGLVPEIKNIDLLPELEKPDSPTVDEGNGEVHVEVIPTLETEEVVQQAVIEQSHVEEPLPEVTEDEDTHTFKISLCYYTFNKYEMGIKKGNDGEAILLGNDASRHSARIDSANGLINLDKRLRNNIRTFDLYRKILDLLHSALLNAENNSDLAKRVKEILTNNNFGNFENSGINIKFGFKSSADAKRMNRSFSSEDGGQYYKFDKSDSETVLYIHARDKHSLDINNKSIVLIIGDSVNGDFLEIPYLQLPHVGTVIDLLSNVDNTHAQIKGLWNSVKSRKDAVGELLNEMQRLGLDKIYPDLVKLGVLFRVTNNVFVDLGNWNPYSNLFNFGIQGVYNTLGTEYGRPGYTYDVPFIPITQLALNSEIKISPILYSKTKSISDGNTTYEDVVIPGLPFVLVSYDSSISDLVKTWLEETKHPGETKKVQRVYVIPPRATIAQYLDNLVNIFDKNLLAIEDIGNDVTAYLLTKVLLSDENFKNNVLFNLKEREFTKLEALLKDLENLDKELLVKKLQSNPEGQNKTYRDQFKLFLKELVKPTGQEVVKYKGFDSSPNRQLITETLEKAGIDGVYYQVRPSKSGEQQYGRFFYKADQNSDWTLTSSIGDKLSYTIHGKIDSNVYSGNISIIDIILKGVLFTNDLIPFNSLFDAISQGKYVIPGTMFKGDANLDYLHGKYAQSFNPAHPAYSIGDVVSYNGNNYTITGIRGNHYEIEGDFGHSILPIDIEGGNNLFGNPLLIVSVHKVGDRVIYDGIEYTIIDVNPVDYLLQDIEGNNIIKNIKVIDNYRADAIKPKFSIGQKIVHEDTIFTITDIIEDPIIGDLYVLDGNIYQSIQDVDDVFTLYEFSPTAKVVNNQLLVLVTEKLTLTSDLSGNQTALNNLALAESTLVEQNSDDSITVAFNNGTKIIIHYDVDSSTYDAEMFFTQDVVNEHTEEEWNQIKERVSEEIRDIIDVPFSEINLIEDTIEDEEIGREVFGDDYDIVKEMLQKDSNPCEGISLKFN